MRIFSIGPLWRGSNAGGLFRAFSRAGSFIEVLDEFYYISLKTEKKSTKIAERIIRPLQIAEFNSAIVKRITTFKPEILLVYKGAFVLPATLTFAKNQGCKIALFYPDVSTTSHGPNIPACIPLYDLVFTTKTYGIRDMQEKYGVKKAVFIPHGYDPEIHRPLIIGNEERAIFGCDVSFIGTWSPKKEKWLAHLKQNLPNINLKIWGDQWHKASDESISTSIQGKSILGDLYAIAIQCSTINLGVLSEQVQGASSGDLITSRTFHIPGASGFMLHERNEESVLYFKENQEAGFFDGPEEMTQMVSKYLADKQLREQVRIAGYNRAISEHSLDKRAKVVLAHLSDLIQ